MYSKCELGKSAAVYQEGTEFMQWTCGRCLAVSEWFMGAPVALFTRMIVYGTTHAQLQLEVEDLQSTYNLLLLENPTGTSDEHYPVWHDYTNDNYTHLQAMRKVLQHNIHSLKIAEYIS